MNETSRGASSETEASTRQWQPSRVEALLSLLNDVWPSRLPRSAVAGLPASVVSALLRGHRRDLLSAVADRLDLGLPGWTEVAAEAVAAAACNRVGEDLQRLAALLAHRPLREPQPLLSALDSCSHDHDTCFWLLVALSGTDTAAVRAAWLGYLARCVRSAGPTPQRAPWFAFLRAFLGGWLSWSGFRDCLSAGRVLAAADPSGNYRRALARLGLSSHPIFSKWYRQVVYEVAHQPDVSLSLRDAGWIRDFPGEDYLFDALTRLQEKPDSWWPLHMLRWTCPPVGTRASGINPEDERVAQRLPAFSPIALCLLSLLRPDLCAAAGRALGVPAHQAALHWLKTTGPNSPLDLSWVESTLRPWADAVGEAITLAAGALCSVEPPADFLGPEEEALRCRAFVRTHLLPEFDRLMDNLSCLHALRKQHFEVLSQLARKGRPPAVRALALWPEKAQESAPILFRLTREGPQLARQAAREALRILAGGARAADLSQLEKRLDLASAWADSGLEGKPARVWWNVAGYHVKLSVAAGAVRLQTYSGSQARVASRRLAAIPKAVRDDPQYAEIRTARAELARGYRYFRRRLEEAMVEEVHYPGRDFAVLLANPMVRSLVSRLLLTVDGAAFHWTPPDPLEECPPPAQIAEAARVSIAHPLALPGDRALADWQQQVIASRIPQPFKQAFREIYLPAERERSTTSSLRFAGRPLVARRAFALLRSRGYAPRRGDAVKEWSSRGLCAGRPACRRAYIRWADPHEDAGRLLSQSNAPDSVTSGAVWFEADAGEALPLLHVPPIVFSETLRDADLLASRAAFGELGFTSEETRRLRATLVRYLTRVLGLTTIYVSDDNTHVIVEGQRAMYRVHLGSGTVLLEKTRRHLDLPAGRQAGPEEITSRALEDLVAESMDSITARILGLIGALSRDDQITDPYFLRQLV